MDILKELKSIVDKTCELTKSIAEAAELTGLDFEKATKVELASYLMYLSASDGTIGMAETEVINKLCGWNLRPADYGKLVREQNIYSEEFEEKVPVTMKVAVMGDLALARKGDEDAGQASSALIGMYELIGQILMKADGETDDQEEVDYKIYTDMLRAYRKSNFEDAGAVSGFTKTTGAVDAPEKKDGGVDAPRKG